MPQNIYYTNIQSLVRFFSAEGEYGYMFAVTDNYLLRQEINEQLAQRLGNAAQGLVYCQLHEGGSTLKTQLEQAANGASLLIIEGLDMLLIKQASGKEQQVINEEVVLQLNFLREFLHSLKKPMFFWLGKQTLHLLQNRAADLFSQRRRSTVFFEDKLPTQLPEQSLEGRFIRNEHSEQEVQKIRTRIALLKQQLEETAGKLPPVRVALQYALPLAVLYTQLSLCREANEVLERYIGSDKTNPLAILENLESGHEKAEAMTELATVISAQGQLDKALDLHRRALSILETQGGTPHTKAYTLGEIARIITKKGQVDKALELFYQQIDIYEELGDKREKAGALFDLSTIYTLQQKNEKAIELLSEAYQTFNELGLLDGTCFVGSKLAPLLIIMKGQHGAGFAMLQRSLEGFQSMGRQQEVERIQKLIQQLKNYRP